MKHMVRCIGLSIAILALAGCGGAAAPGPRPIVFSGRPDDPPSIGLRLMVVNPDGTGARRLTGTDGDGDPSWSPDGTKVAFMRLSDSCDVCSAIWVVDADGGNERRLTDGSARLEAPAWSPDGERIAFEKWDDDQVGAHIEVDVYVMKADGTHPRRLTDFPGAEQDPAWSPDGERIAFSSDRGEGADLYVMNSDGSQPRRLTDTVESEYFPAWSPDGDAIAFERRGARIAIVVLNVDSREERRLRARNTDWGQPAWSPDGAQLAFTTNGTTIWVVDADGRNVRKVWSSLIGEPGSLDWAEAPGEAA
jgi:Tol biopolymer transport system component